MTQGLSMALHGAAAAIANAVHHAPGIHGPGLPIALDNLL
jgi:CO/xanthine dehydrogenase Mo-binding subunit